MAREKAPKTFNVTSSFTLFYKYFLPMMWIIFFGTLMLLFLIADQFKVGSLSPMTFKITYSAFFFGMVILMYFTVFKLKRVEFDATHIYITNYFKILRYPLSNIEKISESNYLLWRIVRVDLIEPGHFGKTSYFLANNAKWETYNEEAGKE